MTQLRDARLRKALEEAPDAHLRPSVRTRDAIRAAAHDAAQPAWKRWWGGLGQRSTPWTAAFATIALATLVVVMWEGQQVPGPVPDQVVSQKQAAPAVAPATPVATETPSAPASAPARSAAPAPAPAPATAPAAAAPPPPPAADALAKAQRRPEDARGAPLAQSAAPAPAPAAPAPTLRAAPTSLPWSQVRIEAGGQSVVVTRPQAGELPALVTSLLASPSDDDAPALKATLRLELAQGDQATGVLEFVGDRWRWTPLRDARQSRLLRSEASVSEALRAEATRLLQR